MSNTAPVYLRFEKHAKTTKPAEWVQLVRCETHFYKSGPHARHRLDPEAYFAANEQRDSVRDDSWPVDGGGYRTVESAARAVEDETRKLLAKGFIEVAPFVAPSPSDGAMTRTFGWPNGEQATIALHDRRVVIVSRAIPGIPLVTHYRNTKLATAAAKKTTATWLAEGGVEQTAATRTAAAALGTLDGANVRAEWRDQRLVAATLLANPNDTQASLWSTRLQQLAALPTGAGIERLALELQTAATDTFKTVRTLDRIDQAIRDPWAADWAAMAATFQKLTSLSHVSFGPTAEDVAAGYYAVPPADAVSHALPQIAHLEMTGAIRSVRGLAIPRLRSLTLRCAAATPALLDEILTLEGLEQLSLWLGGVADCAYVDQHAIAKPKPFYVSQLERFEFFEARSLVSLDAVAMFIARLPESVRRLEIRSPFLALGTLRTTAKRFERLDLGKTTLHFRRIAFGAD